MKRASHPRKPDESGSALALTLIMTGIALAILASAMSWSAHTTQMTHRSIQYTRSSAAAAAGTEKVLSQITRDYLFGGEKLVSDNLSSYRTLVPTSTDSSYWSGWEFNNAGGNGGQTSVQRSSVNLYSSLNSTFASLRGSSPPILWSPTLGSRPPRRMSLPEFSTPNLSEAEGRDFLAGEWLA